MNIIKKIPILLASMMAVAVGSGPAAAQEKAVTTQQPAPAEKYFTNTELVTQDGKTVRFYDDMLKGKVIVINFFFSTCQGSCLPMNRNFETVQALLGERVGKDVCLISLTVDPEMDTPERLKSYATKLNARPGWFFLTGKKTNVDFILGKLGQYVAQKNDHTNIMIIGNEPTGLWRRLSVSPNRKSFTKSSQA
jgi:protein SCO1/2